MSKQRALSCVWVDGNVDDLNRATLKEEFSKFGSVTKIYIDKEGTYAKVYYESKDSASRACSKLSGHQSWTVKVFKEEYKKPQLDNSDISANSLQSGSLMRDLEPTFDKFSVSSGSNLEEMEEECYYAGDYVDVHGRSVEVLQAENGQLYVNLDDVRTAGFNIYPKDSFENATIPKELELRHFENYLLNQGKKYILNFKQTFNENEMLNVFERVRRKLQSTERVAQFGEGRLINNTQNKNFSITARNDVSPSFPGRESNTHNANSTPKQLPENFQPSFSFTKPKRNDRQNGQLPVSGIRRPQQNSKNSSQRNEGGLWGNQANHSRLSDDNSNAMKLRAPKCLPANEKSPPVIGTNKAEESWEGEEKDVSVPPPKSKPPVSSSIEEKAASVPPPKSKPAVSLSGEENAVSVSTPKSKPPNDVASVTNDRNLLDIERVQLAPGANYKVKVSYIKPEKKGLIYAQLADNLNLIEEILLHVNTEDIKLPQIGKPKRNMLCVAYFEDCWYRAVVLHGGDSSLPFVELIDYGNKEHINTPLRQMSDKMKKIPGQAIRCAVNDKAGDGSIEIGQDLEVCIKKHVADEYDDLTHLVEILNFLETKNVHDDLSTPPSESSDVEVPKTPKPVSEEACFTEVPPSTAKIVSGESVMIVNFTENKLILRNKETAIICNNVYSYLREMQRKPIGKPKVGQLVLCSRDTEEGLHRAVIKAINDKTAELEYIDYYGGEILALNSLRNVDKTLASYPSARIELNFPALKYLNEESEALLTDLILKKKKIKATVSDGSLDFLLPEGDKTILLSQKMKELAEPPQVKAEQVSQPEVTSKNEQNTSDESAQVTSVPTKVIQPPVKQGTPPPAKQETPPPAKQETPSPAKQETPPPAKQEASAANQETSEPAKRDTPSVTSKAIPEEEYVDISFDDMPFVSAKLGRGTYSCYCCKGDSITIVALSEENVVHLSELCIAEPEDKTPFAPELLTMCLAKFEDIWYRALVTDSEGDMFEVLFVDYGNAETVNKSDLRRFPKKLATIPILGINAYFVGLPDSPEVHKRLTELIPDEKCLEIDVKVDIDDDLKYGIEIPSVYEILKKEGLI